MFFTQFPQGFEEARPFAANGCPTLAFRRLGILGSPAFLDGCHLYEFHFLALIQYPFSRRGQTYFVIVFVGDVEVTQADKLVEVLRPIEGGDVSPGAVGLYPVVTIVPDVGAGGTAEDVDRHIHPYAFFQSRDRGERLLRQDRPVETRRRVRADVAVATVFGMCLH